MTETNVVPFPGESTVAPLPYSELLRQHRLVMWSALIDEILEEMDNGLVRFRRKVRAQRERFLQTGDFDELERMMGNSLRKLVKVYEKCEDENL